MSANIPLDQPWPALTIDYQLYDEYLENSNLSDEQKREFLDTMWQIIVAFVDLGFGVHPVQQVCGQELDLSRCIADNVLDSKDKSLHPAFSKAVNDPEYDDRKGSIS